MSARCFVIVGLRRALVGALAATVLAACGGQSDAPVTTQDAGASTDSSADAALPPGVAYMREGLRCCTEGLGRDCCRPEVHEACAEFRGCTPAGVGVSAKITCSVCCDGMRPMSPSRLVDGKCEEPTVLDANVCAACGDGICSPDQMENPCSCPEDCGKP